MNRKADRNLPVAALMAADIGFLFCEKVKIEIGKLNVSLTSELLRIPCSLALWNVRFVINNRTGNGIGYVDGHRSTGNTGRRTATGHFGYLQKRL